MTRQRVTDHLEAANRFAGHAEEQLAAGDIPAATALAALATAHAQIASALSGSVPLQLIVEPPP